MKLICPQPSAFLCSSAHWPLTAESALLCSSKGGPGSAAGGHWRSCVQYWEWDWQLGSGIQLTYRTNFCHLAESNFPTSSFFVVGLSPIFIMGFPRGSDSKGSAYKMGMQPTPVFLPGEFHGQRSLADYSLWDCRIEHNWVTTNTLTDNMTSFLVSVAWVFPSFH